MEEGCVESRTSVGKVVLKLAAITVVVLGFAAAAAFWWVSRWLDAPLRLDAPVVLDVPQGQAFARTANQLAELGLIDYPGILSAYTRLADVATAVQAGEYRIVDGQSLNDVLAAMTAGDVIRYQITFVEGWTLGQVLELLQTTPKLDHQLPDVTPETIMSELGFEGAHGEGWFFPDTYEFTRGTSDVVLLRRAHERMRQLLYDAWTGRDAGLPFDSPYEVLVLASIVEKETGREDERGKVARVFVNRLQQGMPLQTDPTVIYGLGDTFDGNLTRAHLNADGPYNTYRRKGLPPTPIALPSRRSIDAVVHPGDGEYLYFVARGDGTSQFSRTLDEHLAAVRRYQLKQ